MIKPSINNKEIFYKHADINEFLREHPSVRDLHDAIVQALYAQGLSQTKTLKVISQAYFIFNGRHVEVPADEMQTAADPYGMQTNAQNHVKAAAENLSGSDEAKDRRIRELEELLRLEKEKNTSLAMQIKEYEGALPDVLLEVTIKSNDELYNAINYLTIKNYAMGRKEAEASVISNMLGKLALRGNLGHESRGCVNAAIEEIDNLHNPQPPQPTRHIRCDRYVETEVHNDNKDSQVFNGNIENSQFGK